MLYRAAQYPELRQRPDTVKHLIMQWHESIGVSLLNALGLPEEIVEAVIDHDHPRAVIPTTIRTLSDVVYLSNILAGAHLEWLYQDIKPPILMENNVKEVFAGLLDEIETDTQTLLAILE
jgi:HD-like signal output (HDOD) protein